MSRASSRRWLARQRRDPYVRRAREEGRRSRAGYKLAELDRRDRLLRPGMVVVDLGAAPGGWSEYAAGRVAPGGRVVAVDRLPMAPIAGVDFVQGDFTEAAVAETVRARLGGPADLVLSDMAPSLSGVRDRDRALAEALALAAIDFAEGVLRPGGDLLVKVFEGPELAALRARLGAAFAAVATRKPPASRARSSELYLLARHYSHV
ncbi:RlmE family RNA methyltransferase [Inmirania thermothiophila]|uniref:Ribosomal RNA large subunit methyltransferase E n=1 Tax=Inmirania thermothiophila TaxID=1750597 RepID=A0A3N1XZR9_9GAMM|nr:RlmE family RNA methyltransferase [Inmirania thermothiophila]ROR32086.1 23S rRNA (uridine2552-2'-O)-methyltransferase [Inmirania thermothiophila]